MWVGVFFLNTVYSAHRAVIFAIAQLSCLTSSFFTASVSPTGQSRGFRAVVGGFAGPLLRSWVIRKWDEKLRIEARNCVMIKRQLSWDVVAWIATAMEDLSGTHDLWWWLSGWFDGRGTRLCSDNEILHRRRINAWSHMNSPSLSLSLSLSLCVCVIVFSWNCACVKMTATWWLQSTN